MSGSATALPEMIDNMTHGGRIALLGLPAAPIPVDWGKVVQVQSHFVRTSFERIGRMNRRYVEAVQAMMTATASTTQNQARKTV